MASSMKGFEHLEIQLEEIISATNNFNEENVIGYGGFGKVYKGGLSHSHSKGKSMVALKRLDRRHGQGDAEFYKEVRMLSSYRHENIISLLGFSHGQDEMILVYEYASRGSLDGYLKNDKLTWAQRLKICLDAAKGLNNLHDPRETYQRLIHCDIKTANILLDENFKAKVSDFGLSKIGPANQQNSILVTNTLGTHGYCDPLFMETYTLTKESDVYSFGVVLFEVLCGKLCVEYSEGKIKAAHVPTWKRSYEQNQLSGIVFQGLMEQMNQHSLETFSGIAYQCLKRFREERPAMSLVVEKLQEAHELQELHDLKLPKEYEGKTIRNEFAHLRVPLENILYATNNFAQQNLIGENSGFHKTYKGQLLWSGELIDIHARRFNKERIGVEKKFWMEISMLSSLKHENLVSLVGICYENDEKIIIYKKEANRSLETYLSDQTLTWMQRLKICLGVANALSYIHYDARRDFSVIHCNVRSSNILLDDEWEPKLSGFELALKNTVARRHRLLFTRDIVKNVYMDPKYEKTGGVSHKSDVYSFGVVLFEILCGRSAVLPNEELGKGLSSKLGKSNLDVMIDPHLRKQMELKSLEIFSETTYCCLKEERADRPYIDQVVKGLEKALELQWKHENPGLSRNVVDGTLSDHLKGKNLEHLEIPLNDIIQATNNFDEAYCIRLGGFGKVYKADLEHFDSSNYSSKEGVGKCDLPRKRSTVAIKRINNPEGEQGFIAEIETLTSCTHENIISLLGFCYEGNGSMILVYEHASKGSLENYLGSSYKMANLNWLQRLNICLDIAHGLNYIHNNTDLGKQKMIHRDINSDNILLGDNWKAKIADFGLSKFHPAYQEASTIYTNLIAGTYVYLDPEYQKNGKLNEKSDIYSFGVVLLEILTGTLAYDSVYTKVHEKGIAPIARDHFEKGTVMEILDYKIKEETDEHVFSLSKGPNKESLDIFLEIAYRCVAGTQAQRPTIEVIINELKKALDFQENHKDSLKLSLEDIKLATQGFSEDNIIGHGDFGNVYRGVSAHGDNIIAAKLLNRKSAEGEAEFMTELEILMEYNMKMSLVL